MTDTTFLTVDYLKEIAPISANVAPEILQPFIPIAEAMWINDKILGTALTTQLKSELENQTLSGDNYTLVYSYIVPTSAWYSYYEASVFMIYRAENKGITKKYSDNSQALDRQEFANYRQSIQDKANYYRNRLIDYLNDNRLLYPNYRPENFCSPRKDYGGGIWLG